MGDVIIRVVDLPTSVGAATVEDSNGDYNIYANARMSFESRMKSVEHELKHINGNDFHNGETLGKCEARARREG